MTMGDESMDEHGNSPEAVAKSQATLDIFAAIGWILLFFALQIIAGVIAIGVAIATGAPELTTQGDIVAKMSDMNIVALPTLYSLIGSNLATIGLLWLYIRRKDRWNNMGLGRWSKLSLWRTLGISIAVIVLGIGFNYLYSTYVIPGIEVQDDLRKLFAAIPKTTLNTFLLFFTIAVLAPITEEILFRGLLQRSLSQRVGPMLAILFASLIFAAIHFDPYAFPALFVLGAAFGYLYHITGSMRVNILMHMINNAAALMLTP